MVLTYNLELKKLHPVKSVNIDFFFILFIIQEHFFPNVMLVLFLTLRLFISNCLFDMLYDNYAFYKCVQMMFYIDLISAIFVLIWKWIGSFSTLHVLSYRIWEVDQILSIFYSLLLVSNVHHLVFNKSQLPVFYLCICFMGVVSCLYPVLKKEEKLISGSY